MLRVEKAPPFVWKVFAIAVAGRRKITLLLSLLRFTIFVKSIPEENLVMCLSSSVSHLNSMVYDNLLVAYKSNSVGDLQVLSLCRLKVIFSSNLFVSHSLNLSFTFFVVLKVVLYCSFFISSSWYSLRPLDDSDSSSS